ncbi:FAD/NAD(P)-binding oxidoreductase, partial [Pseudomonas sp.]|uniref:FAD/NAD(P)-binding oxidoreductase n=1 Tax=Pseudomonas sp. TaxID=306 RepID=UPI002EDAB24E
QARDMREQLQAFSGIRVHSGCKVVALAGPKRLLVEDAERGWVLRYNVIILCTGARERLLPFPGWTLPGVTGAGGLQALIKGGLPVADERTVIAGSGPLLLASSATAQQYGAEVVRVVEQAPLAAVAGFAAGLWRWPNKAMQAITLASAAYRTSAHVLAALGTDRLEGVRIRVGNQVEEIACDRLACGFSLVPNVEIAQALGCTVRDQAVVVDEWQASSLPDHYAAGECTGFGGSELALVEGRIAGLVAVGDHDKARALWGERQRWQRFADRLNKAFRLDPALKTLATPETVVCRCEDVRYADLSAQGSWTSAKLATRCGMGACQGRICATAAQTLFGWEPPLLRPPFSPARISTLACLDEGEPV